MLNRRNAHERQIRNLNIVINGMPIVHDVDMDIATVNVSV